MVGDDVVPLRLSQSCYARDAVMCVKKTSAVIRIVSLYHMEWCTINVRAYTEKKQKETYPLNNGICVGLAIIHLHHLNVRLNHIS